MELPLSEAYVELIFTLIGTGVINYYHMIGALFIIILSLIMYEIIIN